MTQIGGCGTDTAPRGNGVCRETEYRISRCAVGRTGTDQSALIRSSVASVLLSIMGVAPGSETHSA